MTDNQKKKEIIALMSFLQKFIQNNVVQSFTDLTFDLEILLRDFLNIFENDGRYENVNSIKHNFPAVDLINEKTSVAIQVTTNADLRKVRKTVETFQRHGLKYSKLIVIGFVKATKSSLPGVEVHDINYLLKKIRYASAKQLDEAFDVIKRKVPWNSLTPLDDKLCFDVAFDVINRSAVRDYTMSEGDFEKMVSGLFEVKEIITTGTIKGKSIRAKALVEYSDKVRIPLSQIEFQVSEIIQICNANKNRRSSSFLDLSFEERNRIDDLKEAIIRNTNNLASELQLQKRIQGGNRY